MKLKKTNSDFIQLILKHLSVSQLNIQTGFCAPCTTENKYRVTKYN